MTGAHGKVLRTFWTDPDIKFALSIEQKALLLYFFTSPHSNMIGAYYLPLGYVAAEIGLPIDSIGSSIDGALAPFLTYDRDTEEVLVYNMARHQIGEDLKGGDRRKPMVERLLAGIHSPRLRAEFLRRYGHWGLQLPAPRPTTEQPNLSADATAKAPKPHPKGHHKPHSGKGASDAPTHARAVAGAGAAPGSASGSASGSGASAPAQPAEGSPSGGWPAEFSELLSAIGYFAPPRVGKALKAVVGKTGLDRSREIVRVFAQQAPHRRADGSFDPEVQAHHFCTPERLAATWGFWKQHTEPISANGPRSPPVRPSA